jgi:hypothetical protein
MLQLTPIHIEIWRWRGKILTYKLAVLACLSLEFLCLKVSLHWKYGLNIGWKKPTEVNMKFIGWVEWFHMLLARRFLSCLWILVIRNAIYWYESRSPISHSEDFHAKYGTYYAMVLSAHQSVWTFLSKYKMKFKLQDRTIWHIWLSWLEENVYWFSMSQEMHNQFTVHHDLL